MLKIRTDKTTLLIFPSYKFRLMGSSEQCEDDFYKIVFHLQDHIETNCEYNFILQTKTFVFNLNRKINCALVREFFQADRFVRYEPEIFSALELLHWAPTHVNIFHTGKVTILGKNSQHQKDEIINWISSNVCMCL